MRLKDALSDKHCAQNEQQGCLRTRQPGVLGSPDGVHRAQRAHRRTQVLQQYALFADGQLGRWGRRPDGTPVPGVRALVSPITQLFFGEAVRRPPRMLDRPPTISLQCLLVLWQNASATRVI